MKITEFKDKDNISQGFLIKKFEIKNTKNGKAYLDAVLADNSGEISAKLWNVDPGLEEQFKDRIFAKVAGTVEVYNDKLQFRIEKIAPLFPSDAELEELIECAPFPSIKMYDKIVSVLKQIEDDDIRTITLYLFESNKEKLLYYPAAKSYHHAVRGGLLYHTFTMLRGAAQLLEIYTFLNKDLVYAGVALHDIGKIKEMISSEYGAATDYSVEGNLLGHIITTICDIELAADKLNIRNEKVTLLKHMILSHHQLAEYGSPKPPMFAEAELVHYLDVLDARMNQFEKTVNTQGVGTFNRVYNLDSRIVYNHPLNKSIKNKSEE
ncbi:MAG: HD domain-containing protein [Anaerofustis stercorihominis]|nr:HD domain-containing protein [Anaerofustis stercorihominis]